MHRPLRTTWVICAVFCATVFRLSAGLAQTVDPITPSGLNTQINLSATPPAGTVQYDITGGTRSGTNLFHSFGEFGVPNNNIANFLNDTGSATSNILGRVTGGNVSSIFGTIQTTGFGNANLFLMNPAGIVFGPTASLNVGGLVAFTTANYIRLDKVGGPKAGIFHANPAQVSLLTSAPVDAFGFLGSNPGDIAIQGSQLTVPEKQGIALVAGNITIENGSLENGTVQPARLSAPNGQINLATATSPGEFLQDLTAAPNIKGMSFRSFGSVHISPGSTVDFSQTGNGKISIRGGQLVIEIQNTVIDTSNNAASTAIAPSQDAIILTPGSSIISQTSSGDPGPDIQIVADRLQFVGSPPPHLSEETLGPRVNIWARTDGSGDAGNIALRTTGDLEMIDLVRLESTSGFTPDGKTESPVLASGNAGNIQLTSTHGNIRMTGIVTWATSQTGNSSGETGTVTATAPEGDIILDLANLFTRASSLSVRGGQVQVSAQNLRMMNGLLGTDNFSQFKPDGITVTLSGKLTMEGSFIVTSAFNPTTKAPAGDITLTAKDIVATQGSIISSETFAAGAGGQLKAFADTLQLKDGSQIKSGSSFAPPFGQLPQGITPTGPGGDITIQTLGPAGSVLIDGEGSGIFADTEGTGAGGAINLNAKSLTIQNGGTISASTTGTDSRAVGGSIAVHATDHVILTNGASVSASSTGPGDAGNILINAGQQFEMRDSSITTQATQASGGNIDVQAVDRVRLVNSPISTSVRRGPGSGGNITIDPNVVVLQNSPITAQADRGAGGNITITTPLFLADSSSPVIASSQFGRNGTVTIQSPTSNVSGSLGPLTSKPSQTQALLTQRCAALANGQTSSFVVAGHEHLPADPGGWLTSLPAFAVLGENLDADNAVASISTVMAIPADNTSTVSLRRLTPAGFLMANFADSAATGCHS